MSLPQYRLSGVGIHGLLCALVPAWLALTALPASAAGEPAKPPLRVVSPVRLPTEPGPKLAAQASAVRELLERYQDGGFDGALWAVDALPAKNDHIKDWVAGCMDAFPGSVIVALDARLENGESSLPPERIRPFLSALSAYAVIPAADPGRPARKRVSILVNYTALNNCASAENADAAIAAAVQTAKLCRDAAPGIFLWLFVEDCPKASAKIPDWIKAAGDLADGYYVSRTHEWNVAGRPDCEPVLALLKSGKKVLRGGFRYTCPRLRPGLEQDLTEKYSRCIATYEEWVRNSGYAGYAREIGKGIPADVDVNLNLLVERRR